MFEMKELKTETGYVPRLNWIFEVKSYFDERKENK